MCLVLQKENFYIVRYRFKYLSTAESRCMNTELASRLKTCCFKAADEQSRPLQLQQRLSGGRYTLHFLSDAFRSRPAAADRWGLIGAWPPRRRAGELLTKWGVTAGLSETSHRTSRPDLGPRWHMGVKEVRKLSRGGVGAPSCPVRSHETPSCHNRHLPALTLNTHQGGEERGGCFLPLSNRRMEKRKDGGEKRG